MKTDKPQKNVPIHTAVKAGAVYYPTTPPINPRQPPPSA